MKDLVEGILENLETDAFVDSAAGEVKPWA
ncbi:hypothetical protein KOR34_53170 [Posidoniimonas corsicana]|uniref:Uncharacterized protein n=1 Tax=Posidoniimonas corsicana TaxID=1938618 RepID=A0A5C5USY0_9BACT|nr:hypothetical protein KOR34_53170 [Posidoniimonas corsicana]